MYFESWHNFTNGIEAPGYSYVCGVFFLQSPVLIFLFFPLCTHIRNHEREGKKCHLDYK